MCCCFVCLGFFPVSGTAELAQFSLVLHEMQNINRTKWFPIDISLPSKKICCAASRNTACLAINSVFQDPLTGSLLNLLRKYCQEKCVHPAAAQIPRQQPFLEIKTAFLLRKNLSWRDAASLEDFRPSPVLGLQEKNTPLALTQGNDLRQPKSCACPAVHLHDRLLTHRASTAPSVSSPRCSETLITLRVDEI